MGWRSGAEGGGWRNAGAASGSDVWGEHRVHLQGAHPAADDRRCCDHPHRGHAPRKLSGAPELALAAHIRSRHGITLAQA